jgi:putative glutamine amidotransferase
MQRLNARFGGRIYADVEAQHEGAIVHSQKRGASTHPLHIHETSALRRILNVDTLTVNTRHLQAVAELGAGFAAAATAPDGVIEAIEHESGKIFGVQFHPERMGEPMEPIFRHLMQLARAHQASPSGPEAHSTEVA